MKYMSYNKKEEEEFIKKESRKEFLEIILVVGKRTDEEEKEYQELNNSKELKEYMLYKINKSNEPENIYYENERQRQIRIENDSLDRHW